MSSQDTQHLRVLIATNSRIGLHCSPRVSRRSATRWSHARSISARSARSLERKPDVALVGLGESSEHALQLIERIVEEAACPVIVIIHAPDPWFISEAAKRGVFAYITDSESSDLQGAIDIVPRRFSEYHNLEGAFGRRAIIEQAKGILMERYKVDDLQAFEMLRQHARTSQRMLIDVAAAVTDSHTLLPSGRLTPGLADAPPLSI